MVREQRRLAAILFADAVGSSLLMGRNESSIVAGLLQHLNERLAPAVARRGGRVIRLKGDGALVEFASAVDALAAALEFQQAMIEANRGQHDDQAIVFRIGLHLGDVIVEGDDIYGDAVNVAARLEAEAPAGGIVVSRAVREAVTGRLKVSLHALGELTLKNIERPIRAFRAEWSAKDWAAHPASSEAAASLKEPAQALTLPDKPSIAVLPFQNMSGDPEHEYFADGVVEDITTALSRFRSLFVIARNSSFTYKGKLIDTRQVGRELGVRYVLEGSVRKAGPRVRISGRLIDAETGAHRWADRFEGPLDDVFSMQDLITEKVIAALVPTVEQAEIERAQHKPTANQGAHDLYLRGLALGGVPRMEASDEAMSLFKRALELDPNHSSALGLLLAVHASRKGSGMVSDARSEAANVERLVRLAMRIGREDAVALGHSAWAIAYVLRDLPFAREQVERAVSLNPNLATAWAFSGWIHLWSGDPAAAVGDLQHAARLDPLNATAGRNSAFAHAYFFLDMHQDSLRFAERILQHDPASHPGLRVGAASAAFAGRMDTAQRFASSLKALDPAFRISRLEEYLGPYRSAEFPEKYRQGLRIAGLPE